MNKKYEINFRITASRLKRKFTTFREQDALLETFYSKLDKGEKSFLGNRFIDKDDVDDDYEVENGIDNSEAENQADVTEVEQEIEQTEDKDVDMDTIVKEKTSNESEISATVQRKQMFKSLDDILNDNNYDSAPL